MQADMAAANASNDPRTQWTICLQPFRPEQFHMVFPYSRGGRQLGEAVAYSSSAMISASLAFSRSFLSS